MDGPQRASDIAYERERGGGEIVVSNVCGLERKSCNCNKAALVYGHSD
jgi:hypothetical protein